MRKEKGCGTRSYEAQKMRWQEAAEAVGANTRREWALRGRGCYKATEVIKKPGLP